MDDKGAKVSPWRELSKECPQVGEDLMSNAVPGTASFVVNAIAGVSEVIAAAAAVDLRNVLRCIVVSVSADAVEIRIDSDPINDPYYP